MTESSASGRVIFVPVSELPEIEWDDTGKSAQMHFFYTRDAITISLAMPAELLRNLRADIDRVFAERPKPPNSTR
jgi:hypothetical protein